MIQFVERIHALLKSPNPKSQCPDAQGVSSISLSISFLASAWEHFLWLVLTAFKIWLQYNKKNTQVQKLPTHPSINQAGGKGDSSGPESEVQLPDLPLPRLLVWPASLLLSGSQITHISSEGPALSNSGIYKLTYHQSPPWKYLSHC